MKSDISVIIPSIRTVNWPIVLETLSQSCARYSYEVIFVGPFDPPANISMERIKVIKTYRCPSAALQLGAQACEGELICHSVDDAKFIPQALDMAMDLYQRTCGYKDVLNLRYTEDANYSGKAFVSEFWNAHYHKIMRLKGIPKHYKIAMHFLINAAYFLELGGVDCKYEYLNFNLHDLMFRIQQDGGALHNSSTDVTNCNHYKNRTVDHGPIEDAYSHDLAIFREKYSKRNALKENPIKIDLNNWKNYPAIWNRRFKTKLYSTYEEMMRDK